MDWTHALRQLILPDANSRAVINTKTATGFGPPGPPPVDPPPDTDSGMDIDIDMHIDR